MKIHRLLGITIYLLNHKRVSAKILAEKFEVSQRTIQRDIETLCQSGIPVISTFGVDGGYEIIDTFDMERQVAEKSDYSFIITALHGLISAYDNSDAQSTLEKMISLYSDKYKEPKLTLDFSILKENNATNVKLKVLDQAIINKRIITFQYTNSDNLTSTQEVEPIGLTYQWYNWYLMGFNILKKDYRLYKLIRMSNLDIQDKVFLYKHESLNSIMKDMKQQDKRIFLDIKLLCRSEVRTQVIEYLNGDIIEEYPNGDFILTHRVPENEHFWFATILALGNQVEVIEPAALKTKLCRKCQDILQLYNNV